MHLFEPLRLRDVTLRNRIGVSPMCQYWSQDGFASDWHLVHLGSRAVGGAGLVFVEAASVTPEGRITPQDLGIWDDRHVDMLSRIASFVKSQGAAAGMQIAHAGRKASTRRPWEGGGPLRPDEGAWTTLGPSATPFAPGYDTPHALDDAGIERLIESFVQAAERVERAGFDVLEVHAAHGYLLHTFLSPLSNLRDDEWGGSFDNRCRLLETVVTRVRAVWPDNKPLFVRVSATDWAEGGWTGDDTVALARRLQGRGVDVIDCSSGGAVPVAPPSIGPGYQVPFAERVRKEAGIASAAVGLITDPAQADAIVREGRADLVLIARQMLREPSFAQRAAHVLGQPQPFPPQYHRGHWS